MRLFARSLTARFHPSSGTALTATPARSAVRRCDATRQLGGHSRITHPYLLADEPTGNLDTASVIRVMELVRRLRRARPELTVIMVTHDPNVAAAADRIVHVQDGAVLILS